MNAQRRKQIEKLKDEFAAHKAVLDEVVSKLVDLKDQLETIKDEEQEAYDSMPEGLQQGERGTASYDAIASLETAYSALDLFIDSATDLDITGDLEDAVSA